MHESLFVSLRVLQSFKKPFLSGRAVFGGNGFLGSATVEKLLESGDDLTMVNRGHLYWDVEGRIFPKVRNIVCDREQNVSTCSQLTSFVGNTSTFDVVIDFRCVRFMQ